MLGCVLAAFCAFWEACVLRTLRSGSTKHQTNLICQHKNRAKVEWQCVHAPDQHSAGQHRLRILHCNAMRPMTCVNGRGRILGVEIAFGCRLLPCAARACHSCSSYSGLVYFLSIVESDQLLGMAPERSLLALAVLDPFESLDRIWRVVRVHSPPVDSMRDSCTSWLDRICKGTKLDESSP